ncbi:MAG: hypothetical protein GC150_11600 [Rhizobiales bacterium]|nr:hypothetical protein [Hyphomicrobiales bacterium]
MGETCAVTRRDVLIGQGALAFTATLSSGAALAGACATWETATASDFAVFVGETFEVRTAAGRIVEARLASVEPVRSGPDRPHWLARSEGLVATFETSDIEEFVREGAQTCCIRHTSLGTADLYVGPSPLRSGGHVLELVLN